MINNLERSPDKTELSYQGIHSMHEFSTLSALNDSSDLA